MSEVRLAGEGEWRLSLRITLCGGSSRSAWEGQEHVGVVGNVGGGGREADPNALAGAAVPPQHERTANSESRITIQWWQGCRCSVPKKVMARIRNNSVARLDIMPLANARGSAATAKRNRDATRRRKQNPGLRFELRNGRCKLFQGGGLSSATAVIFFFYSMSSCPVLHMDSLWISDWL